MGASLKNHPSRGIGLFPIPSSMKLEKGTNKMFYERRQGKMIEVDKHTSIKDLMKRGNQVFAVHRRFKTDLKLYIEKKLEPKPSPLNYLVRIR